MMIRKNKLMGAMLAVAAVTALSAVTASAAELPDEVTVTSSAAVQEGKTVEAKVCRVDGTEIKTTGMENVDFKTDENGEIYFMTEDGTKVVVSVFQLPEGVQFQFTPSGR